MIGAIVATGTQEPVGNFLNVNDVEWINSIEINLQSILFLKKILPYRNKKHHEYFLLVEELITLQLIIQHIQYQKLHQ